MTFLLVYKYHAEEAIFQPQHLINNKPFKTASFMASPTEHPSCDTCSFDKFKRMASMFWKLTRNSGRKPIIMPLCCRGAWIPWVSTSSSGFHHKISMLSKCSLKRIWWWSHLGRGKISCKTAASFICLLKVTYPPKIIVLTTQPCISQYEFMIGITFSILVSHSITRTQWSATNICSMFWFVRQNPLKNVCI